MGAHNDTANDYKLFQDGTQSPVPPASGGTFNLGGKDRCFFTVPAGTYKLPDGVPVGVMVLVYSSGASAAIQNQSAVSVATLTQDEIGIFVARSSTSWSSVVLPESGAIGIVDATDIPVDDLSVYTSSTNVNDALADNFVYGQFPNAKFTTSSTVTSVTAGAGALTGARNVFWQNTADGAVALTPRTATQMYGDLGDAAYVGMSFLLTIVNRGDNTVTLQAASGVTYTGEQTIATTTTRTYVVTFTSATAATVVSVNKGTIET